MAFPYPGKGQGKSGRSRALNRALAALLMAAAGQAALAAPKEADLPARNLVVEWRLNGMNQAQRQQLGVRTGQIIVDSRGNIVGRTGIGLSSTETERRVASVQQVQVINGGRARLFVGETQSHLVWQWAWMDASGSSDGRSLGVIGPATSGASTQPSPQPRLTAQTVWIDIGQGLHVRPRWPGGSAPVLVELEAEAREPVMAGGVPSSRLEPDGQTRHIEVGSTLSVPLDEWTVVARSGSRVAQQQAGTLSTRELDATESQQLEIRITAP